MNMIIAAMNGDLRIVSYLSDSLKEKLIDFGGTRLQLKLNFTINSMEVVVTNEKDTPNEGFDNILDIHRFVKDNIGEYIIPLCNTYNVNEKISHEIFSDDMEKRIYNLKLNGFD